MVPTVVAWVKQYLPPLMHIPGSIEERFKPKDPNHRFVLLFNTICFSFDEDIFDVINELGIVCSSTGITIGCLCGISHSVAL